LRKSNFIYHLINAVIFVILEVTALNMLGSNGELQRTWISRGAQNVMSFLWGGSQKISDYFSLKEQNDALAQENFELRMRLEQVESLLPEEESLTAALAGNEYDNYRYIPAKIAKISNNTQHNYMIISKGYEDGVTEGSGVITGEGAVGIVDAVSRHHAYARSFKNHEMNISARLGKEGAVGPLAWDGMTSDGAILKEIPHHVEFEKGDTVYTSGYSSIFPPDIPLGEVGEAKVVNGATYEIKVRLFEDFGALRYVTIVENLGKEEMKELEDRL
jgi:rod shape-determining protein MreC